MDQFQSHLTQLSALGNYLTTQPDYRLNRQRLNERIESLKLSMTTIQASILECEEALKLLDENPLIEKLDNLLVKIFGRR